jgi:hypothetical protein
MPLFEHQFQTVNTEVDGKPVSVPPAFGLRGYGPALPVTISATPEYVEALTAAGTLPPAPIQGFALIDTGASITMVDESVCQTLGLQPTGFEKMAHVGGLDERACYPVQITFPNTPFSEPILAPRVVSADLKYGDPHYLLLFGRDLLSWMKFVYNGPAGRFEIAI